MAILISVSLRCVTGGCGGVEVGGVGGGGAGGGDYSPARCWSIDPAREIGIHGVRAGHTKCVRRQDFHPLKNSNFALTCLF